MAALRLHTPFYPHNLLRTPLFTTARSKFTVRSQDPIVDSDPAAEPSPPKKAVGFGSSSSPTSSTPKKSSKKPKTNSKRVIRRSPVQKAATLLSKEDEAKFEEQRKNESAFLLAWLVLGVIILAEGLILASSGFLPEEWDKFFVKYLYPLFTPTVGLFVAGTVVYGVLKYVQNEKLNEQK